MAFLPSAVIWHVPVNDAKFWPVNREGEFQPFRGVSHKCKGKTFYFCSSRDILKMVIFNYSNGKGI